MGDMERGRPLGDDRREGDRGYGDDDRRDDRQDDRQWRDRLAAQGRQDKGAAYGQDYGRAEEGRRTREFGAGWQDQNRYGRTYDEQEGRRQGGMEGGYGQDSGFGRFGERRGAGEFHQYDRRPGAAGGWRGGSDESMRGYGEAGPREGQATLSASSAPGARGYGGDAGQYGGIYSGQGSTQGRPRDEEDHLHEPDYVEWRRAQIRNLDEEYRTFREHRRQRFADEFDAYRKQRQSGASPSEPGGAVSDDGVTTDPQSSSGAGAGATKTG